MRPPQALVFALNAMPLGAPAFRLAHVLVAVAYRFQKDADKCFEISYSEWQRLSGLFRQSISEGLVELVEHNMIEVQPGAGTRSARYHLRPLDEWQRSGKENARTATVTGQRSGEENAQRSGKENASAAQRSGEENATNSPISTESSTTKALTTTSPAGSQRDGAEAGFSAEDLDRIAYSDGTFGEVVDEDAQLPESEPDVAVKQDVEVDSRQDTDTTPGELPQVAPPQVSGIQFLRDRALARRSAADQEAVS